MLFDRLAKCKGRQLILLDACHSGELATENVIRALLPEGQGPTVLAACDQREQSFEDPKVGNGLFTTAVVEALGRPTAGTPSTDDVLDPKELFGYVKVRMPGLLKDDGQVGRPSESPGLPGEPGPVPDRRAEGEGMRPAARGGRRAARP